MEVYEQIDLSRHALVEASAGTGKTYTIEKIVLRILRERPTVTLDQILLVTFTEKAAADMRERIRKSIREAIDGAQLAAKDYGTAQVSTIHGFCSRTLRSHPIETGAPAGMRIAPEDEGVEPALRDVQRVDWREACGKELANVLGGIDFAESWGGGEKFEKDVRQLLKVFRPDCGHQIRPMPQTDLNNLLPGDWGRNIINGRSRMHKRAELIAYTVMSLQKRLELSRLERGILTHDSLLSRLERALDPQFNSRAETLRDLLRQQYRFAIVDEFQDTDPVQWRIIRRLFMDREGGGLILVGDPKQSIYSFRNADIFTYKRAVREIEAVTGRGQYGLHVNFRSSPDILEALNKLFEKRNGKHFFINSALDCPTARPAPDTEQCPKVTNDETGNPQPFQYVNLADPYNKAPHACKTGTALLRMTTFAAKEAAYLLGLDRGGKARLTIRPFKQQPRPLMAGDIALLVFNSREAAAAENALRSVGVPCQHYKKRGVWESPAAAQMEWVLKALCGPGDRHARNKMLLTHAFAAPLESLDTSGAEPAAWGEHFHYWRELAAKREWPELFRSILEDTGLLARESLLPDGERRVTTCRHTAHVLAGEAAAANMDILQVHNLAVRKRMTAKEDDSGLHPQESDRPTAKIMTIHASKGLEFPVVFICGGYSGAMTGQVAQYHDEQERIVYDLNPTDPEVKKKSEPEHTAEDERKLYVALTRAMFRVYVPYCTTSRKTSPVEAVLYYNINFMNKPTHLVCQRVAVNELPNDNPQPLNQEQPQITAEKQSADAPPPPAPAHDDEAVLPEKASLPSQPNLRYLARRKIEVFSFSRLARHAPELNPGADMPRSFRHDDEPAGNTLDAIDIPPLVTNPAIPQTPTVHRDEPPPGAELGDAIHRIMERLDFSLALDAANAEDFWQSNATVRDLFDSEMADYAMRINQSPHHGLTRLPNQEQLCRFASKLIWNTLRTPLNALNGTTFASITRGDSDTGPEYAREIPFSYPYLFKTGAKAPAPSSPARIAESIWLHSGGYMSGFMDMVFRHNGQYYLVDWKSNLLADYSPAALATEMNSRRYVLQYRIYLQALRRWLVSSAPQFDARRDFGGVLYVFMRGLTGPLDQIGVVNFDENSQKAPQTGLFFKQPDKEDWDERALANNLLSLAAAGTTE